MKASVEDLLPVVYRFYPRGMSRKDPGYHNTEEQRHLVAARRAAGASGVWDEMLERLNDRIAGRPVESGSMHLPMGEMDACYIGKLWLPPRGEWEKDRSLGFLVSFLVPHYVIYSSSVLILPNPRLEIRFELAPDELPHARIIVEEIEATFPDYQPMPPDVGRYIVPDITLGDQPSRATTLYDCLFTDSW